MDRDAETVGEASASGGQRAEFCFRHRRAFEDPRFGNQEGNELTFDFVQRDPAADFAATAPEEPFRHRSFGTPP